MKKSCLITLAIALAAPVAAQEQNSSEVNLSTTIIGNQEQPKVLYIVPWKPVNPAGLDEHSIQSQLEMVFGHVEQSELRRELQYLKQLEASKSSEENQP